MEILTCFQIVPDLSAATEADWDQISKAPAEGCFPRVFDCFDEAALEMALTLRDEYIAAGEDVNLRAVTLSTNDDDRLIEKLFALGFYSITRVDFETGYLTTPNVKSVVLAEYISDHIAEPPDLILCGIQSGLGGSRMTGPMIAERLGLPCVGNVSCVRRAPGSKLLVETSGEGVRSSGVVSGRVVLLIGNPERGLLRIPTLKARQAVRGKRAEVIKSANRQVRGVSAIPETVRRQHTQEHCRFIEGDISAKAETVMRIWKGGYE